MEINRNFLDALGFTLVDSLWQGLIIIAVAFLGLAVLKKAPARWRHNFLLVCILALPIGGLYSFSQHQQFSIKPVQYVSPSEVIVSDTLGSVNEGISTMPQLPMETFWLVDKAHWIGLLWLLGLVLVSLRGIGGILYLRKLRSSATEIQQPEIINLLRELKEGFGLQTAVLIKESAKAMSPLVSGYFKPIILFPLGLIQGLTTEEVEVILLHELAHLKRNDFLINIIINGLRAMYFYHPAFWWLQSQLDNEREYATDEMVMSKQSNGLLLVKALAKTQEYQMTTPSLGFAGNSKNQLLKRVNRIMKKQQKPNWLSGVFTMMLLCTAFILMSQSQQEKVEVKDTINGVEANNTTKRISRFTIYPNTPTEKKDSLMATLGPKFSMSMDFDGPISYYNGGDPKQSDSLKFSNQKIFDFEIDSVLAINYATFSYTNSQSDTTSLALAIQEIIQTPSPIMVESNGKGEVISIKRNGKLLKDEEFETYRKAFAQLNQYASKKFSGNTESMLRLAELAGINLKENSSNISKLAEMAGVDFSEGLDSVSVYTLELLSRELKQLNNKAEYSKWKTKEQLNELNKQRDELKTYVDQLNKNSNKADAGKYLAEIAKLEAYMAIIKQEEGTIEKWNEAVREELKAYESEVNNKSENLAIYVERLKEMIEKASSNSSALNERKTEIQLVELQNEMAELLDKVAKEKQKNQQEEERGMVRIVDVDGVTTSVSYDFLDNEKSQKEALQVLSELRKANKNSVLVLDGKYMGDKALLKLEEKVIKSIMVSKGEGLKNYSKRKVKDYEAVIDIKTK